VSDTAERVSHVGPQEVTVAGRTGKVRRRWRTWGVATALAGAVLVVMWGLGERVAAHAIVDAPNAGLAVPEPEEGEFRVTTGPPEASIAYEVDGAQEPVATVLVLHGIRDTRVSMLGWASLLGSTGMRAVLVDLRGHGRSTGSTLSYGVLDAADLSRVLDDLQARGLRAGHVGVLGVSYGAATAIEWAGADSRVERVVAIAPFASLAEVVPGYSPVPLPDLFVGRSIALAGRMGGYDPALASPREAITHTSAPVLLFHGMEDDRIPYWHSREIAAAAPEHSEVVLVDDATHETIMDDPDLRRRAVAWLRALAPDPP
jgi:pimeloyl-ACP methyl ester carboxylesterase